MLLRGNGADHKGCCRSQRGVWGVHTVFRRRQSLESTRPRGARVRLGVALRLGDRLARAPRPREPGERDARQVRAQASGARAPGRGARAGGGAADPGGSRRAGARLWIRGLRPRAPARGSAPRTPHRPHDARRGRTRALHEPDLRAGARLRLRRQGAGRPRPRLRDARGRPRARSRSALAGARPLARPRAAPRGVPRPATG